MYQFIFYALSIAQSSTNFELETKELFSLGKVRIYQCFCGGKFRIESFWSEASEWIPMTLRGVCPVHVSSQYGHSRYRLRHFEHKSHVSKPC